VIGWKQKKVAWSRLLQSKPKKRTDLKIGRYNEGDGPVIHSFDSGGYGLFN